MASVHDNSVDDPQPDKNTGLAEDRAAMPVINHGPPRTLAGEINNRKPKSGNTVVDFSGKEAVGRVIQKTQEQLLIRQQSAVLSLLAEILEAESFDLAALSLVNRIHDQIRCERVVFAVSSAWEEAGDQALRIQAISQQANVDASSADCLTITAALQEAADRQSAVSWPCTSKNLGILAAHRCLSAGRDNVFLRSVPMYHQEKLVGAILIELHDDTGWSDPVVALLDQFAAVAAPVMITRLENNWSLRKRLKLKLGHCQQFVFGWQYTGIKSVAFVALIALIMACLWPSHAQVLATAEVNPSERRLVVAPFDGFIDTVLVRAGDLVVEGQPLLRFDTRDLELRMTKKYNDIQIANADFRVAMADHDRKAMAITQAALSRARAEHGLLLQQQMRAELKAPNDGIVLSDALDHAIGAPVARGATLLQLAPRSGHEVHLLVDEAYIGSIAAGQTGKLTLKAAPGDALAFVVKAIHPIAEASQGSTRFRVTAELVQSVSRSSQDFTAESEHDNTLANLRPGQTGLARIETGRTTMIDRLTRDFANWLRQRWWALLG